MKIKLLFLTAFLGLGQLVNAQTKAFNTPAYQPAANTVGISFQKGYTTSEQKSTEGNRMVVAYEQGLLYNFSLVTIYPLTLTEKMDAGIESRLMKLIADQANYYKTTMGKDLVLEKRSLPAGQNGFAASFIIGDYTYAYRVIVIDNVYYMLSASSLTANQNDAAIAGFFNSFTINTKGGVKK